MTNSWRGANIADMTPSRTYLLLEKALGEPLAELVRHYRADERSWYYIARKISERTGGVGVSAESLRQWFPEPSEPAADNPPPAPPKPPVAPPKPKPQPGERPPTKPPRREQSEAAA